MTVEAKGAWTHGGGFTGYHETRKARLERLSRDRSWWDDERQRLLDIVAVMRQRAKMSDGFASKLKAAESRLRQFEERNERPQEAREQKIDVRLGGARTGKRAVIVDGLALDGLTDRFDIELWFGERVAVLGPNGVGKSHFLRLLAGDEAVAHSGSWRLGAGVVPGLFHQTHEHPEWIGRTLLDILHDHDVVRGPAMGMLRRYELQGCAEQPFDTLSGGQQARFQILLLERSGATLLLLDEPTDNLDLVSAEALEARAGPVHRHRHRRHPRPLVPARVRPLRPVRRRLHRHRPHRGDHRLAVMGRNGSLGERRCEAAAASSEARGAAWLRAEPERHVAAAASASCCTSSIGSSPEMRNSSWPLASTNTTNGYAGVPTAAAAV